MNYEVAIIIPTLNEERFISRCLNSIIKQTYELKKKEVTIIQKKLLPNIKNHIRIYDS